MTHSTVSGWGYIIYCLFFLKGEKVGNIPQGDSIMKEIEQVQVCVKLDSFSELIIRHSKLLE